eukprot:282704-Rhodomonas_salina.2
MWEAASGIMHRAGNNLAIQRPVYRVQQPQHARSSLQPGLGLPLTPLRMESKTMERMKRSMMPIGSRYIVLRPEEGEWNGDKRLDEREGGG